MSDDLVKAAQERGLLSGGSTDTDVAGQSNTASGSTACAGCGTATNVCDECKKTLSTEQNNSSSNVGVESSRGDSTGDNSGETAPKFADHCPICNQSNVLKCEGGSDPTKYEHLQRAGGPITCSKCQAQFCPKCGKLMKQGTVAPQENNSSSSSNNNSTDSNSSTNTKQLEPCNEGTGEQQASAQIKDKTFEKCIRRICAATDSIFLVENNAAVLFPYTDWMAFTLSAKIQTIKANQIDPDIFEIEYNTEGFYNKVTAWYGEDIEIPERYIKDEKTGKTTINPEGVGKVVKEKNTLKIVREDITTEKINTESGGGQISKQYDPLVAIYGELEKRVTTPYPDEETTNYALNALLIQYIRDFNNKCRLRTLNQKKYIGGTFYVVENPFTGSQDMFYLNGYTIRTQKDEPLYIDLDFRYGPEGAEELLDYQVFGGGGGQAIDASGEDAIWKEAAKIPYGSCFSSQNPEEAYNFLKGHEGDAAYCTECYGMSSYLYYRFNNQANIPCQVVGDSSHHVVMLDRGKGFEDTREKYRKYNFDNLFRWKTDQPTTVLLPAPGKKGNTTSTDVGSGGNTNA